jgi:hypothetical protein
MAEIIKQGKCGDNLTWTLDNEGLLTISGEGGMYYYMYTDGVSPFRYTKITKVKILHGVTSIGDDAFYGCSALTSIEIPDSVTFIGTGAFKGCEALTSITIPNSVTWIGGGAFEGCKALTSINVSDGNANYASDNGVLYDKGKETLIQCPQAKTSIEIPNSVTSIGDYAFDGCEALEYNEYDNGLYLGNKENPYAFLIEKKSTDITACSIKDTCKIIGYRAFSGCKALTSIEISNSVTEIGGHAFEGCEALKYHEYDNGLYLGNKENPYAFLIKAKTKDITSCLIDEECYNIANEAFNGCRRLTNIEIPDSVTIIGSRAFEDCKALTSIEIPNSVTKIGFWAFSRCEALTSIEIPCSVTIIGSRAFEDCEALTSIEIPNSVTKIGSWAFNGCKALKKIKIPNSVTEIEDFTFGWCEALTSVKIPNSVTSVGMGAFYWCKALKKIKIPNSVTIIEGRPFVDCEALTNIDVAEDNANYASIDGALFDKEKKILICSPESKTTLKIPHSVTKIEDVGRSLKNIYIQCKHPELLEINEYAFREIRSKNCTLHVPAGSKERYRQHPRFRKFKKIKVKHDNLIEFIKYLIGKFI